MGSSDPEPPLCSGIHAGSCTICSEIRSTQRQRILRYGGHHDASFLALFLLHFMISRHYHGRAFPQRRRDGWKVRVTASTSCTPYSFLGPWGGGGFLGGGEPVGIKPERQVPDGGGMRRETMLEKKATKRQKKSGRGTWAHSTQPSTGAPYAISPAGAFEAFGRRDRLVDGAQDKK